jgi:hypothetical protein
MDRSQPKNRFLASSSRLRLFHFRLILPVLLCVYLISCQASSPQNPSPRVPQPPDETLVDVLIYPTDPVYLDRRTFHQALNELACQLTILYVHAPGRSISADELHAIVALQNRFYRYGLRVIFIDLNPIETWPDLTNQLESASANFPAAFLKNPEKNWLNAYLNVGPIWENQLYIIDSAADPVQKTFVTAPWNEITLGEKIRKILTSRSSSNNRPK